MKLISSTEIEKRTFELLKKLNTHFNNDVFKISCGNITGKYNRYLCELFKENAEIAEKKGLPLCQDTGFVEFFVELGTSVVLEEPIDKTLNRAVSKTYSTLPFRTSMVNPPIGESANTKDNTPAFVHIEQRDGQDLVITAHVKGGGSENLSALWMLLPTTSVEEIIELVTKHIQARGGQSCPPLHVGVGIGGSADTAVLLAKKALTIKLGKRNDDPAIARLERTLVSRLNELKIGVQGFGEGPSVLDVHILTLPRHIAVLPIALAVDCFLCRVGRISL